MFTCTEYILNLIPVNWPHEGEENFQGQGTICLSFVHVFALFYFSELIDMFYFSE